jgi:molecular chaperone HtpG
MSEDEVATNVGTIANSGTRKFLETLKESKDSSDAEFIGQFGVGFYSAFMVADKVELVTRRAGESTVATRWTSSGAGNYTLEDTEKATRGTDITLHLAEGMDEFLEEYTLRRMVKEYSNYIAYPVAMDITRTTPAEEEGGEPTTTVEEEVLNSMKAIWRKAQSEVSDEEYNEFYKHVSHDYTDPLHHIHFHAEGATEFRALLYLPATAPFDLHMREERTGIHLYVKNVFITDDCKPLLPEYLRFVKGVVDSSDLPLNVSREILQDDILIRRINKVLVGRILKELKQLLEKDADAYQTFYAEFGMVLKEGLYSDFENSDKLKELALFRTTRSEDGKLATLRDYVDRMPEAQKEIYFITAESVSAALNSPHLETFKARDYEVLIMTDPVDEWVVQRLTEYDGKKLVAVDRGDIDLASEEEKEGQEKAREEAGKTYQDLLAFIQEKLADDVKEVRLSSRLTDSSCCLVADDAGMNANMERIMRAMNQDIPVAKRILELNPDHPLLPKMKSLLDADKESSRLANYVELVYDQALLTEGSQLKNPLRFAQLVSELMVDAG